MLSCPCGVRRHRGGSLGLNVGPWPGNLGLTWDLRLHLGPKA